MRAALTQLCHLLSEPSSFRNLCARRPERSTRFFGSIVTVACDPENDAFRHKVRLALDERPTRRTCRIAGAHYPASPAGDLRDIFWSPALFWTDYSRKRLAPVCGGIESWLI